jgi:putative tryptophan/tyrosine transport system substrate-binding protein
MQKLATVAGTAFFAMLALLAMPAVSEGQQSKQIPRLCVLTPEPGTLHTRSPQLDVFFQALRDLGYVNGQSIIVDYLSADNHGERFPSLVDDCLRRKADVIFASTTPAAVAAKNATRTTPIVIRTGDPVATGLVKSLAQPGGNVTGVSLMIPELAAKRLQLLKEAVPGISRVMVLTYLVDPIAPLQVKAMTEAAPSLGVTLQVYDIRSGDEIPAVFEAAVREGAQGLVVTAETIFFTYRSLVGELATRHRLPTMYNTWIQAREGGGLMAYSPVSSEVQRRVAGYVERILKGAKPSDLPVEQPTKFELLINLKAAEALGLTIPPTLLARADEVIE